MTTVEDANLAFYRGLYRPQSAVAYWLRSRLSWDQQSKAQLALRMLHPELERRRALGLPTRVLDYGCGWGALLLALPRSGVVGWGYDIVPEALTGLAGAMRLVRRPFAPARLLPGGGFQPCEYDVVVCSHVLEHVEDDGALLAVLCNALAPGGLLLLNVPIHEPFHDLKHARRYEQASLLALVAGAGLAPVEVRTADRLSVPLLRAQLARGSRVRRAALRALRAALALVPLTARERFEPLVAPHEPLCQLLVLARRRQ